MSIIHFLPQIGDHALITITLSVKVPERQKTPKTVWDYPKAHLEGLNSSLLRAFAGSVEANWTVFRAALLSSVIQFIPKKIITLDTSRPWFSVKIK